MKRIEAIIREQYLETVRNHLAEIGVEEFTVTEVKNLGKEKTRAYFRGAEYEVLSQPRLSLTIIANDYQASEILDAIVAGARTGNVGEGTILVTTLDDVIRICNAEIERAVY